MYPRFSAVRIALATLTVVIVSVLGISAQAKRKPDTKKPAAKKAATASRDAKKTANKRDEKRNTASAKRSDDRTAKANKGDKKANRAEIKKAEAERRRVEAERRAAALAEQRRREQARREAIARKLAFERGLRTETIANISQDNIEGEDLNIRRAAVNALGDRAGSVVVMEAQTGRVLTIVNQNWAVRQSIRPCSTIKLVTAAAGLNEGVINKDDGSIRGVSTRRNLDDAIAFSDNGYFQRAGAQIGNTKLVEYGHQLGLGEQTGVNLEGETSGRLPVSNSNARIYSHGDDTEVSTIQLAVMASAITNGGHRVLPRIPRNSVEQAKFQPFYRANVDLPQQNVRRMIPGMMGAAEYGTARRNMDQGLGVAGKTGSCIDKGSWVGLFASVAPIEQPKYAVAVITRGQRERGRYAAAVAADVYRALSVNIIRTDRNLAQTEFKLKPRNVKPADVTADDDEDADGTTADGDPKATNGDGNADGNVILIPNAPKTNSTAPRLVNKTGDSKPVFPPVVITIPDDESKKKRDRLVKPNQ